MVVDSAPGAVKALYEMAPAQAAAKLRNMGEDEVAEALEASALGTDERPTTFGPLDNFLLPRRAQLYLAKAHVVGFLPNVRAVVQEIPISLPATINADASLKDAPLVIRLDRLRAASYPGGGSHHVLFEFTSGHQTPKGIQEVRFNTTCTVREGDDAAIVGYPIFVGLRAGLEGLTLGCRTVNVKNDEDVSFLGFLDSDIFKAGLALASAFQPALAPLGQLALGITEALGKRGSNAVVQQFRLGLDFGETAMGSRLREGTYLAVQVPASVQTAWDWDEWVFDRKSNQVVRKDEAATAFPYNYVAISVSRLEPPASHPNLERRTSTTAAP